MVYFSPTNVTFVSNPEVNPIWYPMEKVKAAINITNAKVSNKSTNPRMKLQNFSMAPPFIGAGLFHSPPSCFKSGRNRGKNRSGLIAISTPMNGQALFA
jgi:hypothetical protein